MATATPDGSDVTLADGEVVLRQMSALDAPFIAEAMSDPAIRRFNGAHDRHGHPVPPPSLADAASYVTDVELAWRTFAETGNPTGAAFLVAEARSGSPLGCCGVDAWTSEDVAQVGYWLVPSARGHGHATRSLLLLTGWLFELGAARTFLTVVAGNEVSAAVARRAGYVYEGTMREHGVWQGERQDVDWFAVLRAEWGARANGAV